MVKDIILMYGYEVLYQAMWDWVYLFVVLLPVIFIICFSFPSVFSAYVTR